VHIHPPTRRMSRVTAFAAVPLAMLMAGGLIWNASYAAFSADTRNSGNNWATGAVVLTDDDGGSARFQASGIIPSQTDTKCITVISNSTLAGTVKLYNLNAITSGVGLEDHIKISVDQGTGGSFSTCTGFVKGSTIVATQSLTAMNATFSSFATGAGSWVTSGSPGETQSYRFTWTFDTTGLTQAQIDALQGAHTGVDFEWEIQNN
jgi:hypothetical protein